MNKFDKLYNKIISETKSDKFQFTKDNFNITEAYKVASESKDPVELSKLFNFVYKELGINKGVEILQTIANNEYIATWTMKKIAETCKGSLIEKQLFLTLAKKQNRIPPELIEAQDVYIKKYYPKLKSIKDMQK